jgi:hypothetical protein
MELKEFISDTLVQLAAGIAEANRRLSNSSSADRNAHFWIRSSSDFPNQVEFDIAVTASEKESAAGGGQIKVWSVAAGGGKEKQSGSESISRISFKVAVADTLA